jgi:hypothetical protein
MWKLKGIRRNADKGRCLLHVCLSEVDVKHVLLDCLETRSWIIKFLIEKYLKMNKEITCRKIL